MLALTLNQISAQADTIYLQGAQPVMKLTLNWYSLKQAYCMSLLKKAFKCSYSLFRKENSLILYI